MTRLSLNETMVLEASGELSESTRRHLTEYLERHPEARQQLAQVKEQLAMLRSIPKLKMSEDTRRRLASNIKQGVQKKLRQLEHEANARRRQIMVYRALAGISAAAAGLVIVASVWMMKQAMAEKRQQESIAAIREAVHDLASLNQSNDFIEDEMLGVRASIESYQDRHSPGAEHSMSNLVSALAGVSSDSDEILPPPDPGSL